MKPRLDFPSKKRYNSTKKINLTFDKKSGKISKMPRRKALYTEFGVSGLSRFGGEITEEYLTDLRGRRGRNSLKAIASTDPTAGAVLFVIKQLMRSGEWDIRPGRNDDSADGRKAAEFVYENLHDMSRSWASTISSICSMFTYGFSFFEIVYKQRLGRNANPTSAYDDGMVGIKKLAPRSQTTIYKWSFDKTGGVLGAIQEHPATGKEIFIPIKKALLFKADEDTDSPESRSILANAYISWYFLKNIREIQGIGIERDLVGLPVIRIPAAILEDDDKATQLTAWKNLLVNIRRDEQEGVLLPYDQDNPDLYKLELLGSPGEKQIDIEPVIERCKAEIAQTALTDFILLGHSSVGSYALSRTKEDALKVAVKCFLENIAGVINSHLIPKLMQLNPEFKHVKAYPVAATRLAKIPNYEELNGLIRSLAFAGFYLAADIDIFNSVLDQYGLPMLTDEQYDALVRHAIEGKIYPSLGSLDDEVEMREESREITEETEETE